MSTRVGLFGVLSLAAVGLFHPLPASAQDRGYYGGNDYGRNGYAQRYDDRDRYDNRGGGWRADDRFREHEWREARERQAWREQQWREQQRCARRDYYRPPAFGFGLRFYGR